MNGSVSCPPLQGADFGMGPESSTYMAALIPIHGLWAFLMAHGLCCAAGLVAPHQPDGQMGRDPHDQPLRPEACGAAAAAAAAAEEVAAAGGGDHGSSAPGTAPPERDAAASSSLTTGGGAGAPSDVTNAPPSEEDHGGKGPPPAPGGPGGDVGDGEAPGPPLQATSGPSAAVHAVHAVRSSQGTGAAAARPDEAQEAAWLTHTAQLYCAGLGVRMLHEQVHQTMLGPRGGGAAALFVPPVRVMLEVAQAALVYSAAALGLQQLHLHAPLPGLGPGGLALAGCTLYNMAALTDDEDSDEVRAAAWAGEARWAGAGGLHAVQPAHRAAGAHRMQWLGWGPCCCGARPQWLHACMLAWALCTAVGRRAVRTGLPVKYTSSD